MEKKFFEWNYWNPIDAMIIQFDDIRTVQQIGDIPIGTNFSFAEIDFKNGKLKLYNKILEYEFDLELQIK